MPKLTEQEIQSLKPPKCAWFMTVTLKPKVYKYSTTTQFELSVQELEHICILHSTAFAFVPEITKQGNVHYHGWITFFDTLNKIHFINNIKKRHNMLGFLKINDQPIEEVDRTYQYIIKELKPITAKAINSVRSIVTTNLNTSSVEVNLCEASNGLNYDNSEF